MQPTFKRGQLVWALWKALTLYKSSGKVEPPSIFRTRIKRLLELDRGKLPSELDGPYAFTDDEYPGTGYDLAFTQFDIFCIAWALVMLDSGMKQADVVWLLRHTRAGAIDEHEFIMDGPRVGRQRVRSQDAPDRPSYEEGGNRYADLRVFALIRKIELVEVFPLLKEKAKDIPVFNEPKYCYGIEELGVALKHMGIDNLHVHVFELAHLAWAVKDFLAKAPRVSRGRP